MPAPIVAERVTKTPDICGGRACIEGHRIPVWVLAAYRQMGKSNAELLTYYPQLTEVDLAAAWEYADAHPDEIDRDTRENEEGYPDDAE